MMGEPIVWPFWYGLCTGRRNLVRTWFLLSLQLTNLPIWNFNTVWSHDCWCSVSVYGHTVSVRYRYGGNPYLYQRVQFFVWWTAVIYAVITVYGYGGQPQMRMTYQLIASCRSGAGPSQVSGRKISEAKIMYWHVLWSPRYLTALRRQDIIVRMPCVLYQSTSFQVVPKTVPVFPNVIQTMWETIEVQSHMWALALPIE